MVYKDPEAQRAACKRGKLRYTARRKSDPEFRKQENAKAREYRRQRSAQSRLQHKQYQATYRRKIRAACLEAYGGKCACCGESTQEFLAIDHVDGGGNAHRRAIKAGGYQFYLWLAKQGYPSGCYRLLCHNCNFARGIWGYCPHEQATPAPDPSSSSPAP